jgi:hypothetical protein
MRTIKLCCLFLFCFYFELSGQHLPDNFLKDPVHIEHAKGMGTGFFIQDSAFMYFVTAKHNFFDPQTGRLLINETFLTSFEEDPFVDDKTSFKIDLLLADSLGLFITKLREDVLIIKMASLQKGKTGKYGINYQPAIQRLTKSATINSIPVEIFENYENVKIGDEIYLFGYPTSLGLQKSPQFDYSRPLLRKGIIAGKYDKNKTLILDCPSYPGNSGGPVIVKVDNWPLKVEFKLVGLVVQFIPYEEQWVNKRNGLEITDRYNSGYSVAVSASTILELIKGNL